MGVGEIKDTLAVWNNKIASVGPNAVGFWAHVDVYASERMCEMQSRFIQNKV